MDTTTTTSIWDPTNCLWRDNKLLKKGKRFPAKGGQEKLRSVKDDYK